MAATHHNSFHRLTLGCSLHFAAHGSAIMLKEKNSQQKINKSTKIMTSFCQWSSKLPSRHSAWIMLLVWKGLEPRTTMWAHFWRLRGKKQAMLKTALRKTIWTSWDDNFWKLCSITAREKKVKKKDNTDVCQSDSKAVIRHFSHPLKKLGV